MLRRAKIFVSGIIGFVLLLLLLLCVRFCICCVVRLVIVGFPTKTEEAGGGGGGDNTEEKAVWCERVIRVWDRVRARRKGRYMARYPPNVCSFAVGCCPKHMCDQVEHMKSCVCAFLGGNKLVTSSFVWSKVFFEEKVNETKNFDANESRGEFVLSVRPSSSSGWGGWGSREYEGDEWKWFVFFDLCFFLLGIVTAKTGGNSCLFVCLFVCLLVCL